MNPSAQVSTLRPNSAHLARPRQVRGRRAVRAGTVSGSTATVAVPSALGLWPAPLDLWPWRRAVGGEEGGEQVSGDTIEVAYNDERMIVRYLMVNAPELTEPFGLAAQQRNAQLVGQQIVFIEPDTVDRDETGALLRYVFLPGEQFVNEILLCSAIDECGYLDIVRDYGYLGHEISICLY